MLQIVESLQSGQQLLAAKQDLTLDLLRTIVQGRELRTLSTAIPDEAASLSLPMTTPDMVTDLDNRIRNDVKIRDNLVYIAYFLIVSNAELSLNDF